MVPGAMGAADALSTASRVTNPINAALVMGKSALKAAGGGAATLIGNLGTHTGAESLKTAFTSGREGGQSAKTFADNMRGNVPLTDVLDTAKANLETMGAQKQSAYRQGMVGVSNDKTVLDFAGIDKAVSDAASVGSFKGQSTNTRASNAVNAIDEAVSNWKKLDPAEYHTPEGMDALKKSIGGILEDIPFEQKTARLAAGKIYNAIKNEIVKQAPTYAETMKGYAEASDQIKEIERALSLGQKASADTAMRKLQSLMRNNVNTNYGNRLDLAQILESQGGRQILPAVAGQALNTWTPRGLGGMVAGGLGMGGYALGGLPAAVPTLAAQSPRLMGEAAFKVGQGAGLADKVPALDPALLQLLYQSGRLPQQQ